MFFDPMIHCPSYVPTRCVIAPGRVKLLSAAGSAAVLFNGIKHYFAEVNFLCMKTNVYALLACYFLKHIRKTHCCNNKDIRRSH